VRPQAGRSLPWQQLPSFPFASPAATPFASARYDVGEVHELPRVLRVRAGPPSLFISNRPLFHRPVKNLIAAPRTSGLAKVGERARWPFENAPTRYARRPAAVPRLAKVPSSRRAGACRQCAGCTTRRRVASDADRGDASIQIRGCCSLLWRLLRRDPVDEVDPALLQSSVVDPAGARGRFVSGLYAVVRMVSSAVVRSLDVRKLARRSVDRTVQWLLDRVGSECARKHCRFVASDSLNACWLKTVGTCIELAMVRSDCGCVSRPHCKRNDPLSGACMQYGALLG